VSNSLPKNIFAESGLDTLFAYYGKIEFNDIVSEKRSLLILSDGSKPLFCLVRTTKHEKTAAPSYFTHAEFFDLDPSYFRFAINNVVDFRFIGEAELQAVGNGQDHRDFVEQIEREGGLRATEAISTFDREFLIAVISRLMYFWVAFGEPVTVMLPENNFLTAAIALVRKIEQLMPYAMRAHIGFSVGRYLQKEHRSVGLRVVSAADRQFILGSAENVFEYPAQGVSLPFAAGRLSDTLITFIEMIVDFDSSKRIQYFERIYQELEGNGDPIPFWNVTGRDYEAFFQITSLWQRLNALERYNELESYLQKPLPLLDRLFRARFSEFMDSETFSVGYSMRIDSVKDFDGLLSLASRTKDMIELNPALVKPFNEGLFQWLITQKDSQFVDNGELLRRYVERSEQLADFFVNEKQISQEIFTAQDFASVIDQGMASVFEFSALELLLQKYYQWAAEKRDCLPQYECILNLFYENCQERGSSVQAIFRLLSEKVDVLRRYYSPEVVSRFLDIVYKDNQRAIEDERKKALEQLDHIGEYSSAELIDEYVRKMLQLLSSPLTYSENQDFVVDGVVQYVAWAFRLYAETWIAKGQPITRLDYLGKELQNILPEKHALHIKLVIEKCYELQRFRSRASSTLSGYFDVLQSCAGFSLPERALVLRMPDVSLMDYEHEYKRKFGRELMAMLGADANAMLRDTFERDVRTLLERPITFGEIWSAASRRLDGVSSWQLTVQEMALVCERVAIIVDASGSPSVKPIVVLSTREGDFQIGLTELRKGLSEMVCGPPDFHKRIPSAAYEEIILSLIDMVGPTRTLVELYLRLLQSEQERTDDWIQQHIQMVYNRSESGQRREFLSEVLQETARNAPEQRQRQMLRRVPISETKRKRVATSGGNQSPLRFIAIVAGSVFIVAIVLVILLLVFPGILPKGDSNQNTETPIGQFATETERSER
jgi:hypothetical protein